VRWRQVRTSNRQRRKLEALNKHLLFSLFKLSRGPFTKENGHNDRWEDCDEVIMMNAVDPDFDDIRKIGDLPCPGRYSGRDDGLYDGLERGYGPYKAGIYTDLSRPYFVPHVGHIIDLPRMGRGVFPCLDHNTTDPFDDEPAIEKSLRDFPWHRTQVFDDYDNIEDGTEDVNKNGRIEGDNGDGIYSPTECWEETDPNNIDTDDDNINDNDEIDFNYNPRSNDTDSDGLNDNIEDADCDGILDEDETDPRKADTDNDGLDDSIEITGWTIVIIYEATKEQKTHYTVSSNPRLPDTDGDGLRDLYEYGNITDPTKPDTDGDGKTDLQELTGDYNSSATGIDGTPPEIWKFECEYEISFDKYLGIKIPSGLVVLVEAGVKDIFGLRYIAIYISGLPDIIQYCNNATNVSKIFEWELKGVDEYKRAFFLGFKINLTSVDRNGNVGFKNDELKSISEMVVSFFLGPLFNIVSIISNIVSGFFSWIFNAIKEIMNYPLKLIKDGMIYFKKVIIKLISQIVDMIINTPTLIKEFFNSELGIIIKLIIITFTIVGIAASVVILICCGIDSLIGIAITLLISILISIIAAAMGIPDFTSIFSIMNVFRDYYYKIRDEVYTENNKDANPVYPPLEGNNNNNEPVNLSPIQILLAVVAFILDAIGLVLSLIGLAPVAGLATKFLYYSSSEFLSQSIPVIGKDATLYIQQAIKEKIMANIKSAVLAFVFSVFALIIDGISIILVFGDALKIKTASPLDMPIAIILSFLSLLFAYGGYTISKNLFKQDAISAIAFGISCVTLAISITNLMILGVILIT